MALFDKEMTLHEMEALLARKLKEEQGGVREHRIIGDLELTCEDYKILSENLREIQQFRYDIIVLEHYKLCKLTAWIFALRYEREEDFIYEEIKSTILELPQHVQRMFIELCESAFMEYGIQQFGVDVKDVEGLLSNLAIHAGVPSQLISAFVAILEDSLQYEDREKLRQSMLTNMSAHMREVYRYIDERSLLELFEAARKVYVDCKEGETDRKVLLSKHPYMSKQIVEACMSSDWVVGA